MIREAQLVGKSVENKYLTGFSWIFGWHCISKGLRLLLKQYFIFSAINNTIHVLALYATNSVHLGL